ncbi:MAG: hypothetical protein ACREMY_32420 [bacterium]
MSGNSAMRRGPSFTFERTAHQHGGPEALFTLSGEVCVETPDGKLVGRAGGEPLLGSNGDVPILHVAAQSWTAPVTSPWTPKGLCPNG